MTAEEWYQEGLKAYENSDDKSAFECFREAAEQGHTNAEYEVGMYYLIVK
jgi:TPR repeat protein